MSIIPSFFGKETNIFDPFSLDIWDPFEGFPFNNTLSASRLNRSSKVPRIINAKIEWKETPEAHILEAHLPGYRMEDVKVEIQEEGVLQITGERRRKQEVDKKKIGGYFQRRFRLPEDAKMELAKATMEGEVLLVMVPKEEVKKKQEAMAMEIPITSS